MAISCCLFSESFSSVYVKLVPLSASHSTTVEWDAPQISPNFYLIYINSTPIGYNPPALLLSIVLAQQELVQPIARALFTPKTPMLMCILATTSALFMKEQSKYQE